MDLWLGNTTVLVSHFDLSVNDRILSVVVSLSGRRLRRCPFSRPGERVAIAINWLGRTVQSDDRTVLDLNVTHTYNSAAGVVQYLPEHHRIQPVSR